MEKYEALDRYEEVERGRKEKEEEPSLAVHWGTAREEEEEEMELEEEEEEERRRRIVEDEFSQAVLYNPAVWQTSPCVLSFRQCVLRQHRQVYLQVKSSSVE